MTQARRIAAYILNRTSRDRYPLDHWLEQETRRIEKLNRADRALVHALVYGVLRWQARLDWIIDHFSKMPLKRIDLPVLTVLRLGLFQIIYLDRIPVSAAVNTSVNMIKSGKHPWAIGFVNGLLRRAAAFLDQVPWPDPQTNPEKALATSQSFPQWLITRWIQRWGIAETESLCRAINTIPSITLRTNTLLTQRSSLIETLSDDAVDICATAYSPEGVRLTNPRKPLSNLVAFKKGWFQIQGEAAQIISHLVAPLPGQLVWDTCAGLGTKTAHLAQLMCNQGSILATDNTAAKLQCLNTEMQRLGINIIQTRVLDLSDNTTRQLPNRFDHILVDAPCSGLGVLRKNPDGKWKITAADLKRYGLRQLAFLNVTAKYLKPNGTLIYAVCSIEPEESTQVIQAFLQNHSDFAIKQPITTTMPQWQNLTCDKGFLRTLPHQHGIDGFFAVVLKKRNH